MAGGERSFRWLSNGPIPARLDLRRQGWRLVGDMIVRVPAQVTLAVPFALSAFILRDLLSAPVEQRRCTLALDIDDSLDRAALLRLGFAEALHSACALDELAVRAARVAAQAEVLPSQLRAGPVALDLVRRDGWCTGRPLRLNPREFALLWHLAHADGHPVCQAELLRELWGLSFRPETNSLAVHVSRLRAKLRLAGIEGLVQTTPDGSYRLAAASAGGRAAGQGDLPVRFGLDDYVRLGDETADGQEDADHAAGIQG